MKTTIKQIAEDFSKHNFQKLFSPKHFTKQLGITAFTR